MFWKLVRPQFWLLDRRVRTLPRWVVPVAIMALILGGQWVYNHWLQEQLAVLATAEGASLVVTSLPSLVFVLLLAAVFGLGDTLHHLYLAGDLELLLIAPVPSWNVFAYKLLQCSRSTWLPALLSAGLLLALGVGQSAPPAYYLLALLLVVQLTLWATGLTILAVLLLGRWLPPGKLRVGLPLALLVLLMLLLPLQQPMMLWLAARAGRIETLAQILLDPARLALLDLLLALPAAATLAGANLVFDRAFHEGWSRFLTRPASRPAVRLGWLYRLPLFPARWRPLMVKDWQLLLREPQGLIGLAQPLVMAAMLGSMAFLGGEAIQLLWFWLLLCFLALFLMFAGNTATTSMALEGRNLALLRAAPLAAVDWMRTKFWATWPLIALPWLVVLLLLGLLLGLAPRPVVELILLALLGVAAGDRLALAAAARWMNFTAENPSKRLPGPATLLVLAGSGIYTALNVALMLWVEIHLAPAGMLATQLRSLTAAGWLHSASGWLPLILGQAVFWVLVSFLWAAGLRRLDRYEKV